jgi:hypothetical protein
LGLPPRVLPPRDEPLLAGAEPRPEDGALGAGAELGGAERTEPPSRVAGGGVYVGADVLLSDGAADEEPPR